MLSGALFTEDFLTEGVRRLPEWPVSQQRAEALAADIRTLVSAIGDPAALNESQTEERLVRPTLRLLGWDGAFDVQVAATRADVPDYLLFPDAAAFTAADGRPAAERFRDAVAVGDAKRWSLGLDDRGGGAGQSETPVGQLLRYMDRAAARSASCRWGVLTNGRTWRLFWQGAADRLQRYFEVDLVAALGLPGQRALPLFGVAVEPAHALALFALFFGREGFGDVQRRALDEGRLYETRVRDDLAAKVFDIAYPGMVRALVQGDPRRPATLTPDYLRQVREAALTLLYRVLFCLYAEDRELLPRRDGTFAQYSLTRLRDVLQEADKTLFSVRAAGIWRNLADLFDLIDEGEDQMGLPPYNGGLFKRRPDALLERASVPDALLAPILDSLFYRLEGEARRRINYRDLSVRELGSIYERLLEHEPAADPAAPAGVAMRLSPFARKGSGSYYTPDMLVRLIVGRTLGPLVAERLAAFEAAVDAAATLDGEARRARLDTADPGTAILKLKVVDPAMGSGHFLVDVVDWLAAEAFKAIGGAEKKAADALGPGWRSPLAADLELLRLRVRAEAAEHRWQVREEQLTDANLVRRLVLKRCVYGVDKNPMAVELAKVALWLHTFTAGAPLSFLDHHLRCGDSLFGEWVDTAVRGTDLKGQPNLYIGSAVRRALGAEDLMRGIEALSDGVLSEAERSATLFDDVQVAVAPLRGFLDVWHALRWLAPDADDRKVVQAWLTGAYGDPVRVAARIDAPIAPPELTRTDGVIDLLEVESAPEQMSLLPGAASARDYVRLRRLLDRAWALAAEQRFLHWQVAFPGVWTDWGRGRTGGFDAVVGNPPWDRLKMQEVEWFAERAPAIARQPRAADRKAMIQALRSPSPLMGEGGPRSGSDGGDGRVLNPGADEPSRTTGGDTTPIRPSGPPSPIKGEGTSVDGPALIAAYDLAAARAETAMRVARTAGDFPLLGRGDINLYSLFVERAQALLRPDGIAGLLTPSGIASDLTAAPFFSGLSRAGRVLTLFDFENGRMAKGPAFPDVHRSFKFAAFVAGAPNRTAEAAECAFFLQDAPGEDDPRVFRLTAADFARVNPNTGTAPIFRGARDAAITRAVYARLPVLVDRSSGTEVRAWPVRYRSMFHMTNDSGLFWTRARLDREGAYAIGGGRWAKGEREWLPLYAGRMIHQFNHRAAGVEVEEENTFNAALSERTEMRWLADPSYAPEPQYWVEEAHIEWPFPNAWGFAFRDIARTTDARTAIGTIVPRAGYGNTAPLILTERSHDTIALAANFAALPFDYACRQKAQSTHLNWYIVEQLPVVPPDAYDRRFGARTAGEIVRDHVLRLSYTAHDLAPFARDLGHVYREGDADLPEGAAVGDVRPPIRWNEAERRLLRARLDALYFLLYGLTDRGDVRHVLSTFPIVRRKDREAHDGVYLTEELVLWFMAALEAGDDARDPPLESLIDAARRRAA